MAYKYEHLIPQNTAPTEAKKIGVYNANGDRLFGIMLGGLSPQVEAPLYSFGLVSDLHLNITDGGANSTRLDNAMTFFENQGASFCCHAGDMTNIGFYMEGDSVNLYPYQFEEYKRICDLHPNLPMYGVCGNHESYVNPITQSLTELQEYTGHGLYYSISQGDDTFIFIGQPTATTPMTNETLQWLYETLETNRNKRCFVFVHSFVADSDSGNPLGLYGNKIFDWWGTKTTAFKNLMGHYKNTILFHGHSHMDFSAQEQVENANFSTILGFRSVHVPSLTGGRKLVDGALTSADGNDGYLVAVFKNCVVLHGYDFVNSKWLPIATYKIDTALVEIEANTFTDSTGTITT